MLTVNVGQGHRVGSAATQAAQTRPCQRAQRPTGEYGGQLPVIARRHPSNSPSFQSLFRQLMRHRRAAETEDRQNDAMVANPRAGQPAQPEDLVDLPHLVTAYYSIEPDPDDVAQQVAFGTSGHRGSALNGAFNEAHILAITQAIVEYRAAHGTTGPLFIGRDTHGLSEPAWVSALEVLAAHDVVAMIDSADRYTPTPASQPRNPHLQPRPDRRPRRRDRRDAVAQPAL